MLRIIQRFVSRYKVFAIAGPLLKLLEAVFDLLVPIVIAHMIDDGVRTGDVQVIWQLSGVLLIMAVLGLSVTLVAQKMAALTAQGVGTDIRNALFEHVNELSYAELDRFGTPSLITRITNDVNQVQVACALGVRQMVRWPFLAIGSMVAALLIDVQLGVVFLVVTPLISLVFFFVMKRCIPYFKAMQVKLDRISRIVRENLQGVRVVRAFVREDHEHERFREAAWDQAETATASGRLSSLLNPTTLLIMDLGVVAILWAGGLQVDTGRISQGEVVAFVNYMTQTLTSIVFVANLVAVFTKASASAARINEVLDCEASVTQTNDEPLELAKDAPALRLGHVDFTYAGTNSETLHDITFELAQGDTLGVIGGTGAGKSTLVNLIPRLYDATTGRVEVMGHDVRDYPFDQLRQIVGIVPQHASLISGTIRSNLTWRGDATDEQLWDALTCAQAADFVHGKAQGLDEVVEAGGKNFSGGQRQRLTIARALVGDPALLVLDDSASALDYATDAALRGAIAAKSSKVACVIVSQRVASVRHANQILVLDAGCPVGLGTHEQLVDQCPIYKQICLTQLKAEEVGR